MIAEGKSQAVAEGNVNDMEDDDFPKHAVRNPEGYAVDNNADVVVSAEVQVNEEGRRRM